MKTLTAVSLLVVLTALCSTTLADDEPPLRFHPHVKVLDGPKSFPTNTKRAAREAYAVNLSPTQLKEVYGMNISNTAGVGQTIAIIDAFAHPNTESDLSVFSTQYGLPQCTTANGCFRRVDQTGGTNYPSQQNTGWAQETGLDVQWAHAIAPGAKILYIEANSDETNNLFTAIQYASRNADYVSMSFGVAEFSGEAQYESLFSTHPTVSYFAAAGDTGEGTEYPAVSQFVIAVGGTTLYDTSATSDVFAEETGWNESGGGCSSKIAATSAQKSSTSSLCGNRRAVPDVSFNANPNSGVLVYVSEGCTASPSCWFTLGGTSLATPMMAARSAVRGAVVNSAFVYGGENIMFRDITNGDNGFSAGAGFDLVTGLGTWVADLSNGATLSPVTSPTNPANVTGEPSGPIISSSEDWSPSSSAASVYMSSAILIICVLFYMI